MPYGDRSGPIGQGPMTGRALGYCTGYDSPGYVKGAGRGMGRGMGRGFGYGRAWGRGAGFPGGWGYGRGRHAAFPYYGISPWTNYLSREDELKMLKAEAQVLKRSQSEIEKRIKDLEEEKSE